MMGWKLSCKLPIVHNNVHNNRPKLRNADTLTPRNHVTVRMSHKIKIKGHLPTPHLRSSFQLLKLQQLKKGQFLAHLLNQGSAKEWRIPWSLNSGVYAWDVGWNLQPANSFQLNSELIYSLSLVFKRLPSYVTQMDNNYYVFRRTGYKPVRIGTESNHIHSNVDYLNYYERLRFSSGVF